MSIAGLVLTMEAAAGMVGSFVGGILFDRWNGKRLMVMNSLAVSLASLSLVLFHTWWTFLVSYAVINLCIGAMVTSVNAAVSQILPAGDRRAFNLVYISRNVGVSAGVALGGLVASASFTYAFILNGMCFAVLPLIIWIGLGPVAFQRSKRTRSKIKAALETETNSTRKFMFLMLGCGGLFTMIAYMQWQSTISVYMQSLGQPLTLYSLLWAVNGILAIALQPLSHHLVRWIPSERGQSVAGGFIFILSFVVLILVHSSVGFLFSMVIATIAEVVLWPLIPAMTAQLAPEGKAGFYQGTMNVFTSGGRLVGPLTGALLYQWIGAVSMLIIMTAMYLIAVVCFFYCRPSRGCVLVADDVGVATRDSNVISRI